MRRIQRALLTLTLLGLYGVSLGQDLHYSQFFRSPMTLNPALTGRYSEDFCVHGIHRNQWKSINSTFLSTAIGADMNFKGGIFDRDKLGVGVMFYNDQLGEGIFKNNSIQLSAAYHRTLDVHKRHHLSAGIQGGIIQKGFTYEGLLFGNQYDPWVPNPDLPSGETFPDQTIGYLDIHAGLFYSYTLNSSTELYIGSGVYQLSTPDESYAEFVDTLKTATVNELNSRIAIHVGANHRLTPKLSILPQLLFMSQSKARDYLFGSLVAYDMQAGNIRLYGGVYYRLSDAGILMAGAKFHNVDVLFSYDKTFSGLNDVQGAEGTPGSGAVGAWEVSVRFCGVLSRPLPTDYTVPCGIF